MKESREGFCRRGKGRSLHAEGPKTELALKPAAESLYEERGVDLETEEYH